jgi:uncharacterized membrane protein
VNTMMCNAMVEDYFVRLDSRLSDLPQARRQDFLMELRAHVMDKLSQLAVVTEADCKCVLEALGTPDEIARQYRIEFLLKHSSWNLSPLTVLRTLLRWTLAGVQGYLVFLVAMIGYTFAACFYITALLKPFFPHNIGMYVSDYCINLANFPVQHGHEVLGSYYIPFAVFTGYLFTFGTTLLIRILVRRLGGLRRKI